MSACADIRGVEACAARRERRPVDARGETRAACWHRGGKVEVGEAQGAEDGLGGESGEEADDDQGREKDQGGGQHGGLQHGLTKLVAIGNRGEEREGK